MILIQIDKFCELTFHHTHTHETETVHAKFFEKTCETAAALMEGGFTNTYILDYFKTTLPADHRDRWMEEKDLRHIANRFKLTNAWRLHCEDAKSVDLFVQQNPEIVAFYQPEIKQNEGVVQEFVLVLQTERQVNYIQNKQEFRVICTDSTYKVGTKKRWSLS